MIQTVSLKDGSNPGVRTVAIAWRWLTIAGSGSGNSRAYLAGELTSQDNHGGDFAGLPGGVDDEVIFLGDQPHQIKQPLGGGTR